MKATWCDANEVFSRRETARPLAQAYNDVVGKLNGTSETVRYIDDKPTLFVQHWGRVTVGTLRKLEETANCHVEVEPLSPHHVLIMMFGGLLPVEGKTSLSSLTSFLFREL